MYQDTRLSVNLPLINAVHHVPSLNYHFIRPIRVRLLGDYIWRAKIIIRIHQYIYHSRNPHSFSSPTCTDILELCSIRSCATRGRSLLEMSYKPSVKFEIWNIKVELLLGYFRLVFPCTLCMFTRTDFRYI